MENTEKNDLHALRHTASHVMAQAVKRLFPGAKLAIGPAIENGFYYDFDIDAPLGMEELEKIEAEMKKIVKENLPIKRYELPFGEALAWAENAKEPYKKELIEELGQDAVISFYEQGEFADLCAGPHLRYTSQLKASSS